jgi:hypothetical protein
MTKKLEELFDMAPSEEPLESITEPTAEEPLDINPMQLPQTKETLANLDKINEALPLVKNLEAGDAEMDSLSDLAQNSYKDLVDLGMNVDSRFSAEIFNAASSFLGHAITAKTAKLNKKLKMIDLQLRKAKLDADMARDLARRGEEAPIPTAEGVLLDRNELLKRIKGETNTSEKS